VAGRSGSRAVGEPPGGPRSVGGSAPQP